MVLLILVTQVTQWANRVFSSRSLPEACIVIHPKICNYDVTVHVVNSQVLTVVSLSATPVLLLKP